MTRGCHSGEVMPAFGCGVGGRVPSSCARVILICPIVNLSFSQGPELLARSGFTWDLKHISGGEDKEVRGDFHI